MVFLLMQKRNNSMTQGKWNMMEIRVVGWEDLMLMLVIYQSSILEKRKTTTNRDVVQAPLPITPPILIELIFRIIFYYYPKKQ